MTAAPSLDPGEVAALGATRGRVLAEVAAACARVGRDPAGVTLVAVSKTVPASRVAAAIAAGLDVLGENRVQEASEKVPLLPGARWHLLGPLQSNKARLAVELFSVVETVDSVALARRLDRIAREVRDLPAEGPVLAAARLRILLQVNVDDDPAKAGFAPGVVMDALGDLSGCAALAIEGLMTIGRPAASPEAARPTFRALRELSMRLRMEGPRAGDGSPLLGPALSMGMSDDYPVAVEEGATIVRVGRALFGERPVVGQAAPGGRDRA